MLRPLLAILPDRLRSGFPRTRTALPASSFNSAAAQPRGFALGQVLGPHVDRGELLGVNLPGAKEFKSLRRCGAVDVAFVGQPARVLGP